MYKVGEKMWCNSKKKIVTITELKPVPYYNYKVEYENGWEYMNGTMLTKTADTLLNECGFSVPIFGEYQRRVKHTVAFEEGYEHLDTIKILTNGTLQINIEYATQKDIQALNQLMVEIEGVEERNDK